MSIINETSNGKLVFCTNCNLYHLEFGNLYFNFNESELQIFRKYVNSIDGDYYNRINKHSTSKRKIKLPTKLKEIYFFIYLEELNELKKLLKLAVRNKEYEHISPVNFNFSLN